MTIGRCALLRSVSLHSSHCSIDPNLFLFIVTSNIDSQWWYSQFWDYESWGLCIREMWPLHTFTDKAFDVEVFVLDPERLPFAGLPTVLTGDRSSSSLLLLLQRAVDSLLLKHCRRQRQFQISFLYRIIHRSYTERESWEQTKWHFYLLDFVKHLANPNNRN